MQIINLGILAHVDAGKTTVTEGLLVHSGVKGKMGRVDDGTTTTDSMTLERQRGMTIRAATVSFFWEGVKINLIDTPGHMDFFAEVERSLSVLDGAVLVISAREGVQPQTRVIFEKLRAMRIPVLLFVNKIDRIGVNLEEIYAEIRQKLRAAIFPMQRARDTGSREASLEALALQTHEELETLIAGDEALMASYLAGEEMAEEALRTSLRHQLHTGALYPLYLGSALHDLGIEPLLGAIVAFFAKEEGKGEAPLCAYIYKVEWDAHDHKKAYFRVFEGAVQIREKARHVGHKDPVFVRGLLGTGINGAGSTGRVEAGDIGILLDTPGVRCGDFLGSVREIPGITQSAQPLLTVGLEPGKAVTRNALLSALYKLTQEDPMLQLFIDPMTEEIKLRLFGMLQREILEALLPERFGITAIFSPVRTLFKQQPVASVEAEMRIFTPEHTHQAGIALRLEPLPAGSGNQYVRQVSYGDLEKPFQNAVEQGVLFGLQEGLGDEVIDTRVTFYDMDYSSVTSTPADYRRLAPLVVKKALSRVPLRTLEPWLRFELWAPLEAQKKVLSALNKQRAILQEVTYHAEEFTACGEAPLDSTKEFPALLQSLTQGQGMFDTVLLEYREI